MTHSKLSYFALMMLPDVQNNLLDGILVAGTHNMLLPLLKLPEIGDFLLLLVHCAFNILFHFIFCFFSNPHSYSCWCFSVHVTEQFTKSCFCFLNWKPIILILQLPTSSDSSSGTICSPI